MARSACTICTDVLSDDVMACPCGHVYHNECLKRWLAVRQTCPTCRKTCRNGIKLFFDNNQDTSFSANDDVEAVRTNLRNEIVKCKTKDTEIEKLQNQMRQITKEICAINSKLLNTEEKLTRECDLKEAFKQQVAYFSENSKDLDKVKQQLCNAQKELDQCSRLKTMLSGTSDEVTAMLQGMTKRNCPGMITELATQLAIMKREIDRARDLRKQALDSKMQMEKEIGHIHIQSTKSEMIINDLKNNVKSLEEENTSLRKKLATMEQALDTASPRSALISRFLHESPAPMEFKQRPVLSRENDENLEILDDEDKSLFKPLPKVVTPNAMPSPIHPGQFIMHGKRSFLRRNQSKKPVSRTNSGRVRMGYDGLGGSTTILLPSQPSNAGRVAKKKVAKPNTISKFVQITSKNNIA